MNPNPMVGCVIVHDDQIIGEGWHTKWGDSHAEVNAIQSVKNKNLLHEATVYVTLEPCSHFGKTPPCSDLLIKHEVRRVVVGMTDPNKLVNGQGLARLEEAGIEVKSGVLMDESEWLNRRFIVNNLGKRPYVILKWAETADGFIARENFDSKWISGQLSRQLVHKWRFEEDGILVGGNTVKYDNPQLNVRDWSGDDPKRIYIDRNLELGDKHLKGDGVICLNEKTEEVKSGTRFIKVDSIENVSELLSKLFENEIYSLIVEGGAKTIDAFISSELWDEARVFHSGDTFGEGIPAPEHDIELSEDLMIGNDNLKYYFRNPKWLKN